MALLPVLGVTRTTEGPLVKAPPVVREQRRSGATESGLAKAHTDL